MSFRVKLKKQNEKIVIDKEQQRVEYRGSYMLELIGFPLSPILVNKIIRKKFGLCSAQVADMGNFKIRFEVKGVAQCVETDVFNEEKGVRIATIKTDIKAYSKASKIIDQLGTKMYDIEKEFLSDKITFQERVKYLGERKEMITTDKC